MFLREGDLFRPRPAAGKGCITGSERQLELVSGARLRSPLTGLKIAAAERPLASLNGAA